MKQYNINLKKMRKLLQDCQDKSNVIKISLDIQDKRIFNENYKKQNESFMNVSHYFFIY